MKGRIESKLITLLALLSVFGAVLSGCVADPLPGTPKLPPGFENDRIPDVDLVAYAYVNQGQPFAIASNLYEMPSDVELHSLSAWDGPEVKSVGARLTFSSPSEANGASQAIPDVPDRWRSVSGNDLYVVQGLDSGGDALKGAISAGNWANLKDKYPEIWEVMLRLPENPPGNPIAVGFLKLDESLLETAADATNNPTVKDLAPALNLAQIEHLVFAIYSDRPVRLNSEFSDSYLRAVDARVLIVSKSGYPGFILDFFFGNVLSRMGMEKVDLNGGKGGYLTQAGFHMALKNKGSYIFIAIGTSKESAVSLLTSVAK